jgi:hypothetical protein
VREWLEHGGAEWRVDTVEQREEQDASAKAKAACCSANANVPAFSLQPAALWAGYAL